MMRNIERMKMQGLRRPHFEVHSSDHLPISGTVQRAINGAENSNCKICFVSVQANLNSLIASRLTFYFIILNKYRYIHSNGRLQLSFTVEVKLLIEVIQEVGDCCSKGRSIFALFLCRKLSLIHWSIFSKSSAIYLNSLPRYQFI